MDGLDKVELYLNIYYVDAEDYKREEEGRWELSSAVKINQDEVNSYGKEVKISIVCYVLVQLMLANMRNCEVQLEWKDSRIKE
jgi:hypothetical protein